MKEHIVLYSCPFCDLNKLSCGHNYSCGDGYVSCSCGGMVSAETLEEAVSIWNIRSEDNPISILKYPSHL